MKSFLTVAVASVLAAVGCAQWPTSPPDGGVRGEDVGIDHALVDDVQGQDVPSDDVAADRGVTDAPVADVQGEDVPSDVAADRGVAADRSMRCPEDFVGGSCGTALPGACTAGINRCVDGALTCVAIVSPGNNAEVCNGTDDDCDGVTDNGVPGEGSTCDGMFRFPFDPPRGRCRRGVTVCRGRMGIVCEGAVGPTAETCNGLDDDCDGATDNGFPCVVGASVACQTACGSTGSGACTSACAIPAAAVCSPPSEFCDGIDDDCDGSVDEGLPAGGAMRQVGTYADNIQLPSVASDGTRFAITYVAGSNVMFGFVGDDGRVVGMPTVISTGSPLINNPPQQLIARTGGWAVAWSDRRDGNLEIYLALLDETGARLGREIRISNAPTNSLNVSIAAIGGDVGLAWSDDRTGRSSIFFARVSSAGVVTVPEMQIASAPTNATDPHLVFTGTEFGMLWRYYDHSVSFYSVFKFLRMTPSGVAIALVNLSLPSSATTQRRELTWYGGAYVVSYTDNVDGLLDPYLAWITPAGTVDGDVVRLSTAPTLAPGFTVATTATDLVATWVHQEPESTGDPPLTRWETRHLRGRTPVGPVYSLGPSTLALYSSFCGVALSTRGPLHTSVGSLVQGGQSGVWLRATGMLLCN